MTRRKTTVTHLLCFSGLPEGVVQLPVPRPLRRPVVLRVRPRVGSLQVHVQVPALHAAGVLIETCLRLYKQLQVSFYAIKFIKAHLLKSIRTRYYRCIPEESNEIGDRMERMAKDDPDATATSFAALLPKNWELLAMGALAIAILILLILTFILTRYVRRLRKQVKLRQSAESPSLINHAGIHLRHQPRSSPHHQNGGSLISNGSLIGNGNGTLPTASTPMLGSTANT